MAPPNVGRGAFVGFGEQTDFDTAVSRSIWLELISFSPRQMTKKVPRPTLTGGTGASRRAHFIESKTVSGTVEVLVTYEGFGLILQEIMGEDIATSGSGPYTHTFAHRATPRVGLTMEVCRGTGSVDAGEIFTGVCITKATFKIDAGGQLRCSLDFVGKSSAGASSAPSASWTTSRDYTVEHHEMGTVSWNSGTYTPKSFELVIDNKLATRQLLGSYYTKQPARSDFVDFTGKLDVEWDSNAWTTGWAADTSSDLAVTFTQGSKTITFTLQNAYIEDVTNPTNGPGIVSQSVSLRGEESSSKPGLKIEVVNAQSSGLAA